MSQQTQQIHPPHIALVRLEYPDGTLNALPGDLVKTGHLTRGKVALLVKMGAMLPKTEWDALGEAEQAQRAGRAFEEIFSGATVEIVNTPDEGEV